MNRDYDGDPIDMTYTHLSERDGETVAGTTADDAGSEQTTFWPSALPEEEFKDWERDALRRLAIHDDSERVAEAVGKSANAVNKTLQKVSCFAGPDETPFPSPERPTWQRVERYLDHPEARDVTIGNRIDDPGGQTRETKRLVVTQELPDAKIDEWRRELLDGGSKREILDRNDIPDAAYYRGPLKGMLSSNEFGESEPPVEWDNSAQKWVPAETESVDGSETEPMSARLLARDIPDATVDEWRRELLNGTSKREIMNRNDITNVDAKRAFSQIVGSSEHGTDVEPVEWENQAWRPVDSERDTEGTDQETRQLPSSLTADPPTIEASPAVERQRRTSNAAAGERSEEGTESGIGYFLLQLLVTAAVLLWIVRRLFSDSQEQTGGEQA